MLDVRQRLALCCTVASNAAPPAASYNHVEPARVGQARNIVGHVLRAVVETRAKALATAARPDGKPVANSYYLEWHMRQRVAPMLFDDTDKEAADALRASIVAPAQRSPAAVTKQTTGLTQDGLPVHSFCSLLAARCSLLAARRPGDLGAQHHHHRHHARLSAHRDDQAHADPKQGFPPSRCRSVASSAGLSR